MDTLPKILLLLLACALYGVPVMACDVDSDGIDDPTAVETLADGSYTWRSIRSTDGAIEELSNFGQAGDLPIPGNYLGSEVQSLYGFVDPQFFWTVRTPLGDNSELNFGRSAISYLGSRDYNGDGVADLAKFLTRCNQLTRKCFRRRIDGNFAIVATDGVRAFMDPITATGRFGGGLSPLFAMDANGDDTDEICYAEPIRRKPRDFRIRCRDVQASSIVSTKRIGKLFNVPRGLRVPGGVDTLALLKSMKKKSQTKIDFLFGDGSKKALTVDSVGTVLVGDYLGLGYDQIGIAEGESLTVLDPETEAVQIQAIPVGLAVDCSHNLRGSPERRVLTSKNVCKVLDCSR